MRGGCESRLGRLWWQTGIYHGALMCMHRRYGPGGSGVSLPFPAAQNECRNVISGVRKRSAEVTG